MPPPSPPSPEQVRDVLAGRPAAEFGEHYSEVLVAVYELYVEMADRISQRRDRANLFFLTTNTGLVGLLGYLQGNTPAAGRYLAYIPIALAGVALSFLWYRIIRSYRDLNSAKFKVVHEIEHRLPLRPYDAEWEMVGRGTRPDLYLPFTHVEIVVPWVFMALHVMSALLSLAQSAGALTPTP